MSDLQQILFPTVFFALIWIPLLGFEWWRLITNKCYTESERLWTKWADGFTHGKAQRNSFIILSLLTVVMLAIIIFGCGTYILDFFINDAVTQEAYVTQTCPNTKDDPNDDDWLATLDNGETLRIYPRSPRFEAQEWYLLTYGKRSKVVSNAERLTNPPSS